MAGLSGSWFRSGIPTTYDSGGYVESFLVLFLALSINIISKRTQWPEEQSSRKAEVDEVKDGSSGNKNLELDANGTAVSKDKKRRDRNAEGDSDEDDDDEDDSEEEESEEEEDEEDEGTQQEAKPELSRTERKELKKKQTADKLKQKQKQSGGGGGSDDDSDDDSDLINPNHVKRQMNISDLNAPRELSRKEREAKEKKEAQDKYWKLHAAGKTDQAKSDLARLAKIRAERDAAAAKRKAEAEAKQAELDAKKAGKR
ncbi:hypothetical protein D9757_003197 [Collybiopsis confluens]|uniref:Casein kinase substrate phosphoprotein PP28 domain-containing protein n=1 Tax=Collybiopsis confluens TaxID=2823264 RepID=A0A8H5HZ75_9AGAR|nr:hypothetical protein D9757_003197 [Collybiopsis confluens]